MRMEEEQDRWEKREWQSQQWKAVRIPEEKGNTMNVQPGSYREPISVPYTKVLEVFSVLAEDTELYLCTEFSEISG